MWSVINCKHFLKEWIRKSKFTIIIQIIQAILIAIQKRLEVAQAYNESRVMLCTLLSINYIKCNFNIDEIYQNYILR